MAALIYSLCALTAATCAALLLRRYRTTGFRLLFWSGLCFVGLTVNNVLVLLDRIVYPDVSFALARLVVGTVALGLLLFGLVWEGE